MHKTIIYSSIYVITIFALSWPVSARTIIDSRGSIIKPGQVLGLELINESTDDLTPDTLTNDDDFADDTTSTEDDETTDDITPTVNDNFSPTHTQLYDAEQLRTRLQQKRPTIVEPQVQANSPQNNQPAAATHLRLEPANNHLNITPQTNDTDQTETLEDNEVVIEQSTNYNQLRLRALKQTQQTNENFAVIERRNTQAITNLPISIDLATNTITISTPAGERTVTILPDQAVQNMLAANILDRIQDDNLETAIQVGGLTKQDAVIELFSTQDQLNYRIHGTKQHRFFGLFPFTTNITATVSAETGEIIKTDQSFSSRFLTLFSTN